MSLSQLKGDNLRISASEITARFKSFLNSIQSFKQTHNTLLLDCTQLRNFDQFLYNQLITFPSEIIPYLDLAANEIFSSNQIAVRVYNLPHKSCMRNLGPTYLDHLVSLQGLVIRTSDVIPEMREGFFRCTTCKEERQVLLQRGIIQEPITCKRCNSKWTFELIHNMSLFTDKQHVKVQELPENVPEGEAPQTIHVCAYSDLVDFVKPGDKVEIVGVYRIQSVRVNSFTRAIKNLYKNYIDVISFTISSKNKILFHNTSLSEPSNNNAQTNYTMKDKQIKDIAKSNLNTSEECMIDIEETITNECELDSKIKNEIIKLSKDPNIYTKLVESLAPSIWGNADIKKGLLLQLLGGVSKTLYNRNRFRGEINILLVGDPSTAKSQFLRYVHKLSQRGIYTSGKGSSAVGLTAYVSKDPEHGEIFLESGALVLSDQGICCIDEFDKMNDTTRAILHEVMEQQTISIAKAGIICQLNARTAILAAANPKQSHYNTSLSVIDNIKLTPSILSRFDLIYIVLDCPLKEQDENFAWHIAELYGDGKESKELLASYLTYARKYIKPKITNEAGNLLIEEYIKMRESGLSKTNITATPRQLESLIRLSEAHARMRLSLNVEQRDVEEGLRLIRAAMKKAYTDPITGQIDMSLICTGVGESKKEKIEELMKKIVGTLKSFENMKGISQMKLYEELRKCKKQEDVYSAADFKAALDRLDEDNVIDRLGNRRTYYIRLK